MTRRNFFPAIHQLDDSDQFVLFYERQVVVRGQAFVWSRAQLEHLLLEDADFVIIDDNPESSIIAINSKQDLSGLLGAENRSLRSLLFADGAHSFATAGKANQIMEWYNSHRYCGACGSSTEQHLTQRAVYCPQCQEQYFPRINPCAIMLVVRGEEILLARSARFKSGFYSCLAGFIEVGETPEQTVIREVREEVGIEIQNVRYFKSQSWPFPSQLMLGFLADYASGNIVPEPGEIEDAGWFNVENLPNVPASDISVAGELIRHYVESIRAGKL